MKKIKILFSIPNFITAGSGREMFNIVENLSKEKFQVTILVEKHGGKLYDEIIEKGYEILINPNVNKSSNSTFYKLKIAYSVSRWLKKYKFDIWQSFHWNGNYQEALMARLAGVKYVYVKKNMNWNNHWILKSMLSSHIIARNTTLIQTVFNSFWLKGKTTFITGAVNLAKFKPIQQDKQIVLQQYNITTTDTVISCIAHILPIKNQLLLVQAVKNIDNVVLLLAGRADDKQYYDAICKYIEQHSLQKKVFLLGNVQDTVALLNTSHIFVLPTNTLFGHQEGCPVALIEAMACGLTCVASNVAGNIDLIHDNKNGYIFKSDSLQHLTEKIRQAIQFPLNSLSTIQEYSLLREAQDFENVYLKLM